MTSTQSTNITWHAGSIGRADRERLLGQIDRPPAPTDGIVGAFDDRHADVAGGPDDMIAISSRLGIAPIFENMSFYLVTNRMERITRFLQEP